MASAKARALAHLRRVRALLAVPERWTRFALARDRYRHEADPRSPRAVRWCLLGAVGRTAEPGDPARLVQDWLVQAARARGQPEVTCFNDGGTHAQVLELVDEVIAAAKELPDAD